MPHPSSVDAKFDIDFCLVSYLTLIGASGCTLYVSPDFTATQPVTAGTASWTLTMPSTLDWIGNSLFFQWIAIDPGVNPLGATTSNAGAALVGC